MELARFKFKDYKITEFGFNSSNIIGDDIALKKTQKVYSIKAKVCLA